MKTIVFLATAILSISAFAFPTVGDRVTFNGTFTSAQGSANFMQDLELSAFDKASNKFTMKIAITLPNGEIKEEEKQVDTSELMSEETINTIMSVCDSQGGKLEKITVVAGEFETCKIDHGDGNVSWLGKVPFGVVKERSVDAEKNVVEMELAMFENGQK